jgi:hypothetical protein
MPEVKLWVGSVSDLAGSDKIRKLEELLPVTWPLFKFEAVHFSAAQWESFLASASKARSQFPVLRLLDRLPAVFVNEAFVEAATRWLGSNPDVKVGVGSADDLSRAVAALIEANHRVGITTEPVVRSIMFATAPVGIGKQISVCFDLAAF